MKEYLTLQQLKRMNWETIERLQQQRFKATVVPIGIEGSYDWWPPSKLLPSLKPRCMAVRVGKPMKFTGKPTKENFLAFQRKAMQSIAKLAKTNYPY